MSVLREVYIRHQLYIKHILFKTWNNVFFCRIILGK